MGRPISTTRLPGLAPFLRDRHLHYVAQQLGCSDVLLIFIRDGKRGANDSLVAKICDYFDTDRETLEAEPMAKAA